ncbi:MAG: GNAT family N-acetyltransferase [Actinophytocola sp.]|uniref:GNAT family N-acetyltransferase n=1 Tax=Actinophytocola sp. TaxID=1872138 RepID=UPI00132A0C2F|nr:GNAT family N-acetyltransferase [Actinophytocola sp.]MPZ84955.1 GNAT family N-acetyltransferase [Actinophytocola sp.]
MDIFLETERLRLRRFTEGDLDLLVELDGDPEVMRYLTGGVPTTREQNEHVVLPRIIGCYDRFPGFGIFATHGRDTGEFVGWFMFRPHRDRPDEVELGYRLRKAAWGKGYATEGSLALVRYGFTGTGLAKVYAETMAVNAASRRVMEKVGLRYESTFHPSWPDPIEGAVHGDVRYTLDRAEWNTASQRKNLQDLS